MGLGRNKDLQAAARCWVGSCSFILALAGGGLSDYLNIVQIFIIIKLLICLIFAAVRAGALHTLKKGPLLLPRMAIPPERLAQARKAIESAARPLFLHDDDCDGVCSFVLLYGLTQDGRGVPVKNSPVLTGQYLRKVEENGPDLIVILDKPRVDEEFLEQVRTPVIWLDHHEPQAELARRFPNVTYLNPRVWDDADNRPTSYWAYQIAQQNLWVAVVGAVGDWFLPEYLAAFREAYPDLVAGQPARVEELYLDTPIGTLIRVLQFNLKGTTSEVRKSIMTFAKVESPYEILKQTSARGRYLWKRYQRLAAPYEAMLAAARESANGPGNILLHLYEDPANTFTAELSNELLIRYPERVILVGRKHEGKWKCSVRSRDVELPSKIHAALQGVEGHGGGHAHACGLVVKVEDWDRFYAKFSELVKR